MATRILKCIDCGAEIVSERKTSVRCPDCQSRHAQELRRSGKKKARDRKREALRNTPAHPCPYCGKPTHGDPYCNECVKTGLDRLHATFGNTNGWDKKAAAKKNRPPIVAGSRGVIPGGAICVGVKRDAFFLPQI